MDFVQLITFQGLGAKILSYLYVLEIQQVAWINKKLVQYFSGTEVWTHLCSYIDDYQTYKIMKKKYLVARNFKIGYISGQDFRETLVKSDTSIDCLHKYLCYVKCMTVSDVNYLEQNNVDIRVTWSKMMHLISEDRKRKIVSKIDLDVLVALTLMDDEEKWNLVELKIQVSEVKTPMLLQAIIQARHQSLDEMAKYLFSFISVDANTHMYIENRESLLDIAMEYGWTARAWLRQNYLDMSTRVLMRVWEINPDEILDYFVSALSIRNAPRLIGLCRRLENVDELHFCLLRYLVDLPLNHHRVKINYCIQYLRSFVKSNIIEDVIRDCLSYPHISHIALFRARWLPDASWENPWTAIYHFFAMKDGRGNLLETSGSVQARTACLELQG